MTEVSDEAIPEEPAAENDPAWRALLDLRKTTQRIRRAPRLSPNRCSTSCTDRFAKRIATRIRRASFAIGHLAQSLDGRIATTSGMSRWLSGAADLLHTHRMRALADAVVVGVNTVLLDDPQLTVRRCAGAEPGARGDRSGAPPRRQPAHLPRWRRRRRCSLRQPIAHAPVKHWATRKSCRCRAASAGSIRTRSVASSPAAGVTWLFIEGGGITVSRFLAASALDRLQITVCPLILGSGRPSILLPEIDDLTNSLRPRTRRFVLGDDVMVECDFNG